MRNASWPLIGLTIRITMSDRQGQAKGAIQLLRNVRGGGGVKPMLTTPRFWMLLSCQGGEVCIMIQTD